MEFFYFLLVLILFGTLTLIMYLKLKSTQKQAQFQLTAIEQQNQQLRNQIQTNQVTFETKINAFNLEKENLIVLKTKQEAELEFLQQKLEEQIQTIEQLNHKFQVEFENLAQKILDDKSEKFTLQNQTNLESLLNPLKDRIKDFERKVENSHKESLEKNASLKQQIEDLSKLNERINQEAQNLTSALKGDHKKQGNWGEIVLERILERSGLRKDHEYFVQKSFTDSQQKRLQPDVILSLPENKSIVIDAKVSLVAFEKYFNAEDEQTRAIELKNHLQSVRQHIKSLSDKNYQNLYQLNSLDFVLLFVPIESAFATTLQNDQQLFTEAFEQNIVLVSPTTLLATLRTIASIWKYEYQNRHAFEIAKKGADLYDQFANLTIELTKLGSQIQTVQNTYDATLKKMTGKGNLIRKVEDLKKMGLVTTKSIPQKLINQSDENAI